MVVGEKNPTKPFVLEKKAKQKVEDKKKPKINLMKEGNNLDKYR